MKNPLFIILMGVSGSGKTVVGKALAQKLGWDFYDADDFHAPENIAKMTQGIPLNDADRALWLVQLNELIFSTLEQKRSGVLACSALKENYRQRLAGDSKSVKFVYLKGSYALIYARLSERKNHYMKADLLQSQFAALEEPRNALTVDISLPVNEIVKQIVRGLFAYPHNP